jgi:MFS family permease
MMTVEISTREDAATLENMLPVISASTLGTAIDWFDFFLYGFLAVTVFPSVFFPQLDPFAGIIASFTTNFVGFAARPLGGAFFGWFGDRTGRQSTLVATLLLVGTTTIMMGILPGYATVGIAAPILLFVLRFLQGLGVGGEWGGAVLLTMEYGDDRNRGFWTSWPQTGVPLGLALSALSVLLFRSLYPSVAFQSIGWRIPFLLSAMLVLVGLYIRLRIQETPRFARVKAERRDSQSPLIDVFRYHWREVVLSALARSGEQAPFYIFTTFVLSYAVGTLGLETLLLYTSFIGAALIAFITMPAFGALSDRIGRRRWSLIGVVVLGAFAFPYFLLLNTRNPLLVVIAIALSLGLCHAWLYGPQAALIAERFSTRLRYTGSSLGYQLASIIAGGPAPIIATYLLANRQALAPGSPPYMLIAAYIIVMAAVSLIALLLLKEYAGKAAVDEHEVSSS